MFFLFFFRTENSETVDFSGGELVRYTYKMIIQFVLLNSSKPHSMCFLPPLYPLNMCLPPPQFVPHLFVAQQVVPFLLLRIFYLFSFPDKFYPSFFPNNLCPSTSCITPPFTSPLFLTICTPSPAFLTICAPPSFLVICASSLFPAECAPHLLSLIICAPPLSCLAICAAV